VLNSISLSVEETVLLHLLIAFLLTIAAIKYFKVNPETNKTNLHAHTILMAVSS
jgi:hypothetical protein